MSKPKESGWYWRDFPNGDSQILYFDGTLLWSVGGRYCLLEEDLPVGSFYGPIPGPERLREMEARAKRRSYSDDYEVIAVQKDCIPAGGKLVEAYETDTEIVVCGEPPEEPEGLTPEEYDRWIETSHNCDGMGCGTLSHVIYRADKDEVITLRAHLFNLEAQAHRAIEMCQAKIDSLAELPCRVDEMTEREYKIFEIASDLCGFIEATRKVFTESLPREQIDLLTRLQEAERVADSTSKSILRACSSDEIDGWFAPHPTERYQESVSNAITYLLSRGLVEKHETKEAYRLVEVKS